MRYKFSELLALTRTPAGRIQIADGIGYRMWPLLSPIARLYRATLARKTGVIAVVGSFGKTTTTRAITLGLGLPLHQRFSYNCWTGVARALLRIRPSQQHAVIEAGISDVGQMIQYARIIRPDFVVVTSIGSEHHRSLRTLETTRDEKANMVRQLKQTGTAILNGDDPNVVWMKSQTKARIVTYGFAESNDIRASDVELDWPAGTVFTLHSPGEKRRISVRLIGKHMLYPILAAVAVAYASGISIDQVVSALKTMEALPGRLQQIELSNGVWIVSDAYKSVSETIDVALDLFAQIPAKRRIVALGSVTEPSGGQGSLYREIGARLAAVASRVVVISTTKEYRSYVTGAAGAGLSRADLIHAGHSPQQAVAHLREILEPGDVLLIKGRFDQHLERIALSLQGRVVGCDIEPCNIKRNCAQCPMLERGWGNFKPVM